MAIEYIDRSKCNNCGVCYEICPMDVFGKMGKLVYIAYHKDCMTCHLCEYDCSPDAIYVSARRAEEEPAPF
ncbi:ferredoxin family protein [Chloroflexota bacterium]